MDRCKLCLLFALVLVLPAWRAGAQTSDQPDQQPNPWKVALDCSDDDWTVIEPRLEKVLALESQPYRPMAQRYHELRHLVKHDARADLIQDKLEEFRQAREEAELLLAQSEADLRAILTIRQEAQLVMMGVLE
jgi:hypothetical protein